MHDWIEKMLTPREYDIFTMYNSSMKPRHIAEKLGIKNTSVSNRIQEINKKIEKHKKWLMDVKRKRGLEY